MKYVCNEEASMKYGRVRTEGEGSREMHPKNENIPSILH